MKELLDKLANEKNSFYALNEHPDPLQVAKKYQNDKNFYIIALLCALFAYGNARAIVKFLNSFDFSLLDKNDLANVDYVYRFQNKEDIKQILLTMQNFKNKHCLKEFCENSYKKNYKKENVLLYVIFDLIKEIYSLNDYNSNGYSFYFSKINNSSAYKRYCMFFRWMVRKDELDFGCFNQISTKDLLIPLDTHTHKMGLKLQLIKSKQANQKAMLEFSKKLKEFDKNDPIKYDFALYRISQLKDYHLL
ncbi:TIGR02757 family protein [Campylobacter canadensis]|uniref:TIGR02757 family protein n=1 Tax=Campylobacter canadensis TaxID=449520 RepID=A0ABS7WSK3_9BACT|nr:TIGR02757 family protein [Campylobacter canadensis]MBZ7986919.1 TIGR02757 family protein [Campylobacter canadensis]MBZ7994241.1 TIGR02757 family protein [Campylobacter canadensis]MBZ7995767.1 TIGR02757 family protein [Campylobacter canadensis]MBZ7997956.1 TIGR02757 family protein [Campylobacter canadensis]MBZ7999573.1 TIGR02757 family protein [Campylobacter canadensis]